MIFSITRARGIYLCNVFHSGLSKVIYSGMVLGRFGFYVIVTAQ